MAQSHALADGIEMLRSLFFVLCDALKVTAELQIFIYPHFGVKSEQFRQISYIALRRIGIGKDIMSVNLYAAGGGAQIAGQNIHGGGFADAVKTQQTDDLTLTDGKAYVRKNFLFPVIFHKMLHFNQASHAPFLWCKFFAQYASFISLKF